MHSYLHVVDDIATAYAELAQTQEITRSDLSKITGMQESTLRNRLSNNKEIDNKNYSGMDALRTIQIRDEIKKYHYKLEKFTKNFNFTNPRKENTFVSWHLALLEHGLLGDSIEAASYLNCIQPEQMKKIASISRRINDFNLFDGYFQNGPANTALAKSLNTYKTEVVAYSGSFRSLILELSDHPYGFYSIIDSGFIRSLFPDFQNR